MAFPDGFFRSISKINSLGEGLAATNDVIQAALTVSAQGGIVDSPTEFTKAFNAVSDYHRELLEIQKRGVPLESPLDFRDGIVIRLWVEVAGAQGVVGALDDLSLYKELSKSAQENLPKILSAPVGFAAQLVSSLLEALTPLLVPVVVGTVIIIVVLRKKAVL